MNVDLLAGSVDLATPPGRVLLVDPPSTTEHDPEQDARDQDQEKHTEALQRFAFAVEAETEQRARELDDLWFEEGTGQWPAKWKEQRGGHIDSDGRAVPARPCLTINKLDQPIQQVIAEARAARLSLQIKPKGNGSRDIAQTRQGLIRAIEVQSRAQGNRLWSLDRTVKCGRGFYRVLKLYANDGDFDCDLAVARILNQHSVYLDPNFKELDASDAEWAFITHDYPEQTYQRLYKTSALATANSDQLKSLGDSAPGWVHTTDQGARTYRVAEYFRVVYRKRTLVEIQGLPKPMFLDELPAEAYAAAEASGFVTRTREVDQRIVEWYVMNGLEFLDQEEWEGRWIPIVFVPGKEYFIDGKRIWKGLVANAKDAQRSYNVMRSEQVTAIGLSSKAPWIMPEGQDEGYEKMWDEANTKYYSRLYYKPTTFEGHLVPPPHRDVAEPAIQAITLAANIADADLKATTGRFDPSLGRPGSERSGKAIKELKVQGETSTSNYLDALASIAMPHEADILNDMLEYVYDSPGRVVSILDEEDEDQQVMLGVPYEEADGGMNPLQPGVPFDKLRHKKYELGNGSQYRTVCGVGQSFQTRREEGVKMMGELIAAAPQLAPMISDLLVGAMDFPGSKQISERLKKANPYAKDEGTNAQIPPEVQAQMQQMQQQMQLQAQQLQQLQMAMQTEQAKYDAQKAIKQIEVDSRELIAKAEIAAKMKLADIQAQLELSLASAKAETDQAREVQAEKAAHAETMVQLAAEHAEGNLDRRHDIVLAKLQGHEAEQDREAAAEAAKTAADAAAKIASKKAAAAPAKKPAEKA